MTRNEFLPLPAKTLGAALEQVAAEFERQRAIRRRQLRRAAYAGFIACGVFLAGADLTTWPGRAAFGLAVICAIGGFRAFARLRRT